MGVSQMLVLTDTLRQIELAARLDGAAGYLLPLRQGLTKLFADGHEAHASNPRIKHSQIVKLAECEECSRVQLMMGEGPLCIDNDRWKQLGDQHDFGAVKPSVDLLMFVEDSGHQSVVMVEAKLGGATRRKGDAPQRPTQNEICEKHDWTVKRLKGQLTATPTLWLIVSSNTLMKMRRKTWRWNKSDSSHQIACTCCADFLSHFGIQLVGDATFKACAERPDR